MSATTLNHPSYRRNNGLRHGRPCSPRRKELTHLRDEMSRQRLELPWVLVEKKYVFEAPDGPSPLQIYSMGAANSSSSTL